MIGNMFTGFIGGIEHIFVQVKSEAMFKTKNFQCGS